MAESRPLGVGLRQAGVSRLPGGLPAPLLFPRRAWMGLGLQQGARTASVSENSKTEDGRFWAATGLEEIVNALFSPSFTLFLDARFFGTARLTDNKKRAQRSGFHRRDYL